MSMPEENFEIATGGSNADEDREKAIDQLGTANECDELAELARTDDLADRYRERAETLLEDTPDDAGVGP